MGENSYDSAVVAEAAYQSPVVNAEVTRFSVGTFTTVLTVFNPTRSFIVIQNTGSVVFIKFGLGVSLSDYSFQLNPNGKASIDRWGGVMSAIRESGTSDLIVTEVF